MAVRRSLEFLRTTAIGGLLVIVPVAVVLFVLGQLLFGLYGLWLELIGSEHLPGVVAERPVFVMLLAAGSLVGLCFATGLFVRTRVGSALRDWFGRRVASRIPMYRAITAMTERFAGVDGEDFVPVEVDVYASGSFAIGFLVEKLPGQRAAVFIPSAPVATVGNVLIVPEDRIRRLNASVSDTISAITQWGVDAELLYKHRGSETQRPEEP